MPTPRLNPLSRRPARRRLVVAVRGPAGVGKSVFAASLADAGLGRLCFFDTERKARLLPGSGGQTFDALEIEHPDELPEFIDWALGPDGREQGYGVYALDSWAMYFARKHRDLVQTVRERTGDVAAQPSADELAADQMVLQEVLRRLCVDSGACVVITDQIAAKGREDREENERGRVLPMTTGGLEYFVDVMLEMTLRLDGFETVRVARVVKSNSPAFPVGMELVNPVFRDLLDRLDVEMPMEPPAPVPAPMRLVEPEPVAAPAGPSLEGLMALASAHGLSREQVTMAARHYCRVDHLEDLTAAEISDLVARLEARYGPAEPAPAEPGPVGDGLSGDGATHDAPTVAAARRAKKAA